MERRIIVTYTEVDKALLKKEILDNPCLHCKDSYACCGCSAQRAYDRAVLPYREADIYEIAVLLKSIRKLERSIKESQLRLRDLRKQVPEELEYLINDSADDETMDLF